MTAFEIALAEYKAALAAADVDLSTDIQRKMYSLHVDNLAEIENRYTETARAYDCRLLIESDGIVHKSDVLKGPATAKMREAFNKLVHAVREAYGT
ncbi:MAG TPA: hypothetical protein VF936_11160 [Burkholderiales bacterium]